MKTLENNTVPVPVNKTANKCIQKKTNHNIHLEEEAAKNGIPMHKLYAGISSKFIKCIWEQHDKSDMEISQDVFSRLSEDVTYKLWELANTMKTYARHSGGHVSVELVNEILKDSNVSPILGAFDGCWDKIEYDRTYYFQSETIVDLSKEFLNVEKQRGECPALSTLWVSDNGNLEKLVLFSKNICEAIFLGNAAEVSYGIDMTYSHPQIGCIAKIILKKCIEILAIDYTQESLERCLMFLSALAANPKSRDADIDTELLLISELFIYILLGPINKPKKGNKTKAKARKSLDKCQPKTKSASKKKKKKKKSSKYPKVLEEQTTELLVCKSEIKEEVSYNTDMSYPEPMSIDTKIPPEIANKDYGNIFAIMQKIKKGNRIKKAKNLEKNKAKNHASSLKHPTKTIYTKKCTTSTVGLLCRTIGNVSSRWGIAEEYIIAVIGQRIDTFFKHKKVLSEKDSDWFCRLVHGLWALGEFAFRKILVYMHILNPQKMPDSFKYHLNVAAIFMKGSRDNTFYNWLYEICGDSILPYMIYYQNYSHQLSSKSLKRDENYSFKIFPTVKIYTLNKTKTFPKHGIEIFPEYKAVKKIMFNLEPFYGKDIKIEEENSFHSLFGNKIVVGKRRAMKVLTNQKKRINYNDIILFNL